MFRIALDGLLPDQQAKVTIKCGKSDNSRRNRNWFADLYETGVICRHPNQQKFPRCSSETPIRYHALHDSVSVVFVRLAFPKPRINSDRIFEALDF